MKASEVAILRLLKEGKSIGELASETGFSRSHVSRVLGSLVKKGIVSYRTSGRRRFYYLSSPLGVVAVRVAERYPWILRGRRLDVLRCMSRPVSFAELQALTGLSAKTLSTYLSQFRGSGIAVRSEGKFTLNPAADDVVRLISILEADKLDIAWEKNGEMLKVSDKRIKGGSLTAYSVFEKYSVKIYPEKYYYHIPPVKVGLEEAIVHAAVFMKTKMQKILLALLYMKNSRKIDHWKLFMLSRKYGVAGKVLDLITYVNRPDSELREKAEQYRIRIRDSSVQKDIEEILKGIDGWVTMTVEIYIIGGANMVLRGLKTATKDVDMVVPERRQYYAITQALRRIGFVGEAGVFERGDKRVDLFVEQVFDGYMLSSSMMGRAEKYWEGLRIKAYLLSLEDVFLLKTYSGREIDLEDCKAIAEKGLNWKIVIEEAISQQEKMEKVITITLLDALDILNTRYHIDVPAARRLKSLVSEKLIMYLLRKPMTVKEIVYNLEIPESTVRKRLMELEKKGLIRRTKRGREYIYVRVDS